MGAEDLNPGPHACTVSTLSTELSLQPCGVILNSKQKCSRIPRTGEEEKTREM